jgi:hypothetical protein
VALSAPIWESRIAVTFEGYRGGRVHEYRTAHAGGIGELLVLSNRQRVRYKMEPKCDRLGCLGGREGSWDAF